MRDLATPPRAAVAAKNGVGWVGQFQGGGQGSLGPFSQQGVWTEIALLTWKGLEALLENGVSCHLCWYCFVVVELLSCVQLFATP